MSAATPMPVPAAPVEARAAASLPRFTPAANCLADIYQVTSSCVPTGSACSYFHLGDAGQTSNEACFPNPSKFLATECPISYTSAYSYDRIESATTHQEIKCCPDLHSFEYHNSRRNLFIGSDNKTEQVFTGSCVATSALFSGAAPWTITVTQTSPASTATVTFDPKSDALVADPIDVQYVIDQGKTCVPDCQTPWTGGPSPVPKETELAKGSGGRLASPEVGTLMAIMCGVLLGPMLLGPSS